MIVNKKTGLQLKPTIFPDKTSQVWQLEDSWFSDPDVWWYFEGEHEIFWMLQLHDLLRLERTDRGYETHTRAADEPSGLDTVYQDGVLLINHEFEDIRSRVKESMWTSLLV